MTAFEQHLSGRFGATRMQRNREVLFFVANAVGWCIWGVGQALGAFVFAPADMQSKLSNESFLILLITGVATGFLLSSIMRYACRWLWTRRASTLLVGAAVVAYISALPFRAVINGASWRLGDWERPGVERFYDWFMGAIPGTYLFLGWMGIYFGFHFYEANLVAREAAARAMTLAQATQIKMLRYQLNPHFLFNTLNAVSSLIMDGKTLVADAVVVRLANFLRYTLDQDPMKTVSLQQELAALNQYLEIEQLRFGGRLSVTIEIDPLASEAAVPGLLLQPLIENAIKYAISPSEAGGSIHVRGRIVGDAVELEVRDNGAVAVDLARMEHSRGVGLRNTRERLIAMYGDRGVVEYADAAPGLKVTLRFPARRTEAVNA